MNIVLSSTVSNYFEIFSLEDLDNIHETLRKFFSKKEPIEAKILSINESISESITESINESINEST